MANLKSSRLGSQSPISIWLVALFCVLCTLRNNYVVESSDSSSVTPIKSAGQCDTFISDKGSLDNIVVFVPRNNYKSKVDSTTNTIGVISSLITSGKLKKDAQITIIGDEIRFNKSGPLYNKNPPYKVFSAIDLCKNIDHINFKSTYIKDALDKWAFVSSVEDFAKEGYMITRPLLSWFSLKALLSPAVVNKGYVDLFSPKIFKYYNDTTSKPIFINYDLVIIEDLTNITNLHKSYIVRRKYDKLNNIVTYDYSGHVENKYLKSSPLYGNIFCPNVVYNMSDEEISKLPGVLPKSFENMSNYKDVLGDIPDYSRLDTYNTPAQKIIIDSYSDPDILAKTIDKFFTVCNDSSDVAEVLSYLIAASYPHKVLVVEHISKAANLPNMSFSYNQDRYTYLSVLWGLPVSINKDASTDAKSSNYSMIDHYMIDIGYVISTNDSSNNYYNHKLTPYSQSFTHQFNVLSKLADVNCVNKVINIYTSDDNKSIYYVGPRQKPSGKNDYELNGFEKLMHPLINSKCSRKHFDNHVIRLTTSIPDAYNTRLKVQNKSISF